MCQFRPMMSIKLVFHYTIMNELCNKCFVKQWRTKISDKKNKLLSKRSSTELFVQLPKKSLRYFSHHSLAVAIFSVLIIHVSFRLLYTCDKLETSCAIVVGGYSVYLLYEAAVERDDIERLWNCKACFLFVSWLSNQPMTHIAKKNSIIDETNVCVW